ncbi:Glycosyltransferase involved in cell wall bisynthesis [Amphritea atlantica]|uniref:Glycosyltransferase involved in cell wall bisynthesis n=2 Tax=Amphritea atlantica TaxID=355243 RepID=A0A1H9L6V8_9GAMM|nr:Glycosyltransferase involved in cell wall bisynthesis [Amphritea atlantica]
MLHELGVEFYKLGHQVVVVTPGMPDQSCLLCVEHIEGVEVWFFRAGKIRGCGYLKRAINETLISFRAIRAIRNGGKDTGFDLCINYSPTIFFCGLARYFKSKGAFVYLVLRDFFPQWIIDEGIIKEKSLAAMFFRFFERKNYLVSDRIALQSPANEVVFSSICNIETRKLTVLYNWTDPERVTDFGYGKQVIESFLLDGKIIFFYGGNIGHAQDMENIMRLARRMRSFPRAHFLLVGQGDEYQLVQDRCQAWTLDNVTLLPSVSQEQYISILTQVDVGLFSLSCNHRAHNFPGKLLGYMVEGLPIIGSVNPGNDVIDLINDSGAGLVSINGDDDCFYSNAIAILSDSEKREEMGIKSRQLMIDVFAVSTAVGKILEDVSMGRFL